MLYLNIYIYICKYIYIYVYIYIFISELGFGPLQASKMGSFERIVGNFAFYLLSQGVILDVVKKTKSVPSQLLPVCQWTQGNS